MYSVKKTLLLGFLLVSWATAKDPLVLLRQNRFLEAIQQWDLQLAGGGEKSLRAYKGQALAYQRLGELYQVFYEFNQELSQKYLQIISQTNKSNKIPMYLGQVEFTKGNYESALEKFEKLINNSDDPQTKELAEVYKHYTLVKLGKKTGAYNANPRIPLAVWQSLDLSGQDNLPERIPEAGARSTRCRLALLLRNKQSSENDIEQTLNLLLALSDDPETYHDKGQLTQINFYDPMLLHTISQAFLRMAIFKNQKVKAMEDQFPDLAAKFETDLALAELYTLSSQIGPATKLLSGNSSEKAQLIRAKIAQFKGDKSELKSLLGSMVKSPQIGIAREAAFMYHSAGLDSKRAEKVLVELVGKSQNNLNFRRLGKVLLERRKFQNALDAFQKGYKIQYRNDIEQNDPEYMIDYTQAIFRSSKMRYEEVVETLYHIQKAFPGVRQMHYFMQGIAAKDAQIYNSENIIRKG